MGIQFSVLSPTNWEPKANTGKATAAEITHYQSIIGSLLYLMIGTRPDIAFTVTHLSQFSTNPTKDHYKAVQHVCCYLVGTRDYKFFMTSKVYVINLTVVLQRFCLLC